MKVSKEGRRNIPKAFEIFTDDRKFILKAKDGSNAQEWVQCLSVAKAHSQVFHENIFDENTRAILFIAFLFAIQSLIHFRRRIPI